MDERPEGRPVERHGLVESSSLHRTGQCLAEGKQAHATLSPERDTPDAPTIDHDDEARQLTGATWWLHRSGTSPS